MIVRKQRNAEIKWPIANQRPAKMNQITFPTAPSAPVPMSSLPVTKSREALVLPNGKNAKVPIVKHALPHGMPTIEM